MGSFGSTRWKGHQAATAPEHCHGLSMPHVLYLDRVDRDSLGCRLLRDLAYRVVRAESGEPYLLEAGTTAPASGGCSASWRSRPSSPRRASPSGSGAAPLEAEDGTACGRLVRVLYVPAAGMEFGCRHCHRLVYRRNQIRDKNSYRRAALIRAQG